MEAEERQEKIDALMIDLDDNAKLRTILRLVFKDAVGKLDDEYLNLMYYTLHPPETPPEGP